MFINSLLSKLHSRRTLTIITVSLLLMSIYILFHAWTSSVNATAEQALTLAAAAEAALPKSLVSELAGVSRGVRENSAYDQVKDSLRRLAALNSKIAFAFLYTVNDDQVYLLADSGPEGAQHYAPFEQEGTAAEIFAEAVRPPEAPLIAAVAERRGDWVSVLVPVRNHEVQQNMAVLGIVFPAANWYDFAVTRTIQAAIIVFCLFVILFVLSELAKRNWSLQLEQEKVRHTGAVLKQREALWRAVFEQAPIGITLGSREHEILDANPAFAAIVGRAREELKGLKWEEFTHPDDIGQDAELFAQFAAGEISGYSMKKRYLKPDYSAVWTNISIVPLHFAEVQLADHLCLTQDISEQVSAEQELRESERMKAMMLANLPGMAYRCYNDEDWTMQYVSAGCCELTGYRAEALINNREISYNELIAPAYRDILWQEWQRVLAAKTVFKYEYQIITAAGEVKWVYEQGQGIYDEEGQVEALEGLIIDVSAQKKREAQIKYLSERDFLTGLYNRQYFEEQKQHLDANLPLTVIYCDINGVKLINDAFGHAAGDKLIIDAARILNSCCRDQDLIARTGGDEFTILLPDTDSRTAEKLVAQIRARCREHNAAQTNEAFCLHISIGFATRELPTEEMSLIIKRAEDNMYRRKLLEQKSSHSAIVSSIRAAMLARSQETEEHAERLTNWCRQLGQVLGLKQTEIDDLLLLATLHDIGKMGIDDAILNKPGKLSEEEWIMMRKHPEIGYRIAMSSPDLIHIADYILSHHERWDGTGYPQGLCREKIPLLSRILAVVDAYDAMTEDRAYRKALSPRAAVAELQQHAGTQFDPVIVEAFVEKVLGGESK